MYRQKSFEGNVPTLTFVPTPIGNLDDITLRSLKALKEADVIFAEDTRVTRKLLSFYEIDVPLKSYHEHNKEMQSEEILSYLRENHSVVLVSDAGMPIISDPGFELVKQVRDEGFYAIALPGANAMLTALVASGIKAIPFSFIGFLDSKSLKRKREIENLKYKVETLIFYETPHRIQETLRDFYEIFGDRKIVLARELTKLHEEYLEGNLSEFQNMEPLKGEMVLIVEGLKERAVQIEKSLKEQVDLFIKEGYKKTEAMKKVSELTGIPKNKIYQDYLDSIEE